MDSFVSILLILGIIYYLPIMFCFLSIGDYFMAKAKFINCEGESKYPHRYKWFFDFFRKDKKK